MTIIDLSPMTDKEWAKLEAELSKSEQIQRQKVYDLETHKEVRA